MSPGVSAPGSPAVPGSSAASGRCLAGRAELAVSPGDPVRRRLCVRPGTVVTLVLRPRPDDKRWKTVRSSAPALVVASGWRLDADGTAHATLRCAGTRGGEALVTVTAGAPDVAGAARPAFTLDVRVVPYAREG
ncbi:acetyl-CoA synthetase [Streptomyces sp. NPDC015684]|uniref:acetyl-CoA synthetase n=1 Tax=unclassified Streptomyces TaxID=2593676 RepID=UPI0036FD2F10